MSNVMHDHDLHEPPREPEGFERYIAAVLADGPSFDTDTPVAFALTALGQEAASGARS